MITNIFNDSFIIFIKNKNITNNYYFYNDYFLYVHIIFIYKETYIKSIEIFKSEKGI